MNAIQTNSLMVPVRNPLADIPRFKAFLSRQDWRKCVLAARGKMPSLQLPDLFEFLFLVERDDGELCRYVAAENRRRGAPFMHVVEMPGDDWFCGLAHAARLAKHDSRLALDLDIPMPANFLEVHSRKPARIFLIDFTEAIDGNGIKALIAQVAERLSAHPDFKAMFSTQGMDAEGRLAVWEGIRAAQRAHGGLLKLGMEEWAEALSPASSSDGIHREAISVFLKPMHLLQYDIRLSIICICENDEGLEGLVDAIFQRFNPDCGAGWEFLVFNLAQECGSGKTIDSINARYRRNTPFFPLRLIRLPSDTTRPDLEIRIRRETLSDNRLIYDSRLERKLEMEAPCLI